MMDDVLSAVLMLAVPAYWVLQYFLGRRYLGGWRIAALIPLAVMVPLAIVTVWAFISGSNLWPIMILLVSPVALIYLAAVAGLKAVIA